MIRGTSSSSHLKKGSSDATTLLQGGSWISKFAPDTSYPIFSNIFREPFEQHTLQLHSLPFFFCVLRLHFILYQHGMSGSRLPAPNHWFPKHWDFQF